MSESRLANRFARRGGLALTNGSTGLSAERWNETINKRKYESLNFRNKQRSFQFCARTTPASHTRGRGRQGIEGRRGDAVGGFLGRVIQENGVGPVINGIRFNAAVCV